MVLPPLLSILIASLNLRTMMMLACNEGLRKAHPLSRSAALQHHLQSIKCSVNCGKEDEDEGHTLRAGSHSQQQTVTGTSIGGEVSHAHLIRQGQQGGRHFGQDLLDGLPS